LCSCPRIDCFDFLSLKFLGRGSFFFETGVALELFFISRLVFNPLFIEEQDEKPIIKKQSKKTSANDFGSLLMNKKVEFMSLIFII